MADTGPCQSTAGSRSALRSSEALCTLLADPEHKPGEPYSVAREGKSSYERSTYVIDGNVARVLRQVNPDQHADEVLAALAE